jgi:hypothetical protein
VSKAKVVKKIKYGKTKFEFKSNPYIRFNEKGARFDDVRDVNVVRKHRRKFITK